MKKQVGKPVWKNVETEKFFCNNYGINSKGDREMLNLKLHKIIIVSGLLLLLAVGIVRLRRKI